MSKAIANLQAAQQRGSAGRPKVGGFPYLAETLRRAGVTRNVWFLPACESLYLTADGPVVMQEHPLVTGAADVPPFDQNALIAALRVDQAGESTFPEFLSASWHAGVVRFDVDFNARAVTYYGCNGEAYSEQYSSVELCGFAKGEESMWNDNALLIGAPQTHSIPLTMREHTMPTMPPAHRITLSPAVRALLETDGPKTDFLKHFLRYLEALIAPDPAGLDLVMTLDSRFHELEAMGLPRGLEGLKTFRCQVNAAIPDEHISVNAVRFEGSDTIEADLVMEATQKGEIFGIPPTGRRIRFDVHERCRFVSHQLAERWAQVDIEGIKRQLTDPIR